MNKNIPLIPQSLDIDKQFIDHEMSLKRLRRRGLLIAPEDESIVTSLLKQHGYYQIINSYGDPFEEKSSNSNKEKRYKANISFFDIYNQFFIDHQLGKTLFNFILDIEEHFTNTVAYSVAKHFSVNNY